MATKDPQVTYDLPKWDDWSYSAPEWRDRLEADVYVDAHDVGRGTYLTGRVSWCTLPGREGWQRAGDYLYRVEADGSHIVGALDPTDRMRNKVRDDIAPILEDPTLGLRIRIAQERVRRDDTRAKDAYERALNDTLRLAYKMEQALGLESGALHRGAYGAEGSGDDA